MAGPPAPPRRPRAELIRVLRVLGYVGALGIVAYVAVEAVRDAPPRDLRWPLLVAAVVPAVGWWLLLARGWAVLMSGAWTRADANTWFRTQALRYLPGGIWAPVSRVAVVPGSARTRVSTVAAENGAALCAALAVAGVALAASGRFVFLPLVLALAGPAVLTRLRILPQRTPATVPGYTAGFALYALAAVLAQAAVSGWEDPFAVAGAAALAWGAGLVVVIAPSGIGVREVVYVGLLSATFADADLAAAAVVLRLVTIVAELGVLALSGLSVRRQAAGKG